MGELTVVDTVRDSIAEARTPDGSYHFDDVWRFAIGRKPLDSNE